MSLGGGGTQLIAKTVPVPWIGTTRAKHHRVHSFSRWWILLRCTVISSVMNEWVKRVWMMLTGENRSTRRETSSGATCPPQFARVLPWVRHSSHVYRPGSATVHTCTGLGSRQFTCTCLGWPQFTRVLVWIRHSSHVYWSGSATVHTCTGLGPRQFTRVLAWVRHSLHVYWPGSTAVHACIGRGWNRELGVDRLANSRLNCGASLLRLKDKHIISCVDGDKCGMYYILLAIDVVTSDLFGVPHTENRVVECYR
jgi:hypothetical protein